MLLFFFPLLFYVPGLWFVNPHLDFQSGLVLPFKLSGNLASLLVKFIRNLFLCRLFLKDLDCLVLSNP